MAPYERRSTRRSRRPTIRWGRRPNRRGFGVAEFGTLRVCDRSEQGRGTAGPAAGSAKNGNDREPRGIGEGPRNLESHGHCGLSDVKNRGTRSSESLPEALFEGHPDILWTELRAPVGSGPHPIRSRDAATGVRQMRGGSSRRPVRLRVAAARRSTELEGRSRGTAGGGSRRRGARAPQQGLATAVRTVGRSVWTDRRPNHRLRFAPPGADGAPEGSVSAWAAEYVDLCGRQQKPKELESANSFPSQRLALELTRRWEPESH